MAIIIRRSGFTCCEPAALEMLAEAMHYYLGNLVQTIKKFTESGGRTSITWIDLTNSNQLDSLMEAVLGGVYDLKDGLEDEGNDDIHNTFSNGAKRKKKKRKVISKRFISDSSLEVLPPHFPPFPPEHSYLSTKVIY